MSLCSFWDPRRLHVICIVVIYSIINGGCNSCNCYGIVADYSGVFIGRMYVWTGSRLFVIYHTVCNWISSQDVTVLLVGLRRQAEVAQGVPGRLRPPIFLTFRHYKGRRSSAIGTDLLCPRRNPWYSLSEAESTSGHMVLLEVPRKKSPVTPPGIDPVTVRLAAQCLNHYATPVDTTVYHLLTF